MCGVSGPWPSQPHSLRKHLGVMPAFCAREIPTIDTMWPGLTDPVVPVSFHTDAREVVQRRIYGNTTCKATYYWA